MKIFSHNSKSAFTLVEIMIVVSVIGILSAIAIPNFAASRQAADKNTCLANIRQLEGALARATLETNASIGNLSEDGIKSVVESDYIRHMPHCAHGVYSTDSAGSVYCSVDLPKATASGGRRYAQP